MLCGRLLVYESRYYASNWLQYKLAHHKVCNMLFPPQAQNFIRVVATHLLEREAEFDLIDSTWYHRHGIGPFAGSSDSPCCDGIPAHRKVHFRLKATQLANTQTEKLGSRGVRGQGGVVVVFGSNVGVLAG